MNKKRRKKLEQAQIMLDNAVSILEDVQEEEQEAYDNMPESFQEGEKGEKAQSAISSLEDAVSSIEQTISSLGEIE